MWVGVWTPTAMPFELERSFFLDWVRLADQAGFDTLSSLDRPNYDMWDPLASLAAAAAVTQRIRPATTTLPLPSWATENEESSSFRAPASPTRRRSNTTCSRSRCSSTGSSQGRSGQPR